MYSGCNLFHRKTARTERCLSAHIHRQFPVANVVDSFLFYGDLISLLRRRDKIETFSKVTKKSKFDHDERKKSLSEESCVCDRRRVRCYDIRFLSQNFQKNFQEAFLLIFYILHFFNINVTTSAKIISNDTKMLYKVSL